MHLSFPPLLVMFLLICAGTLVPVEAAPAGNTSVLYSTDFSQDTGWVTNSHDSYFLENGTGRYHYLIEGGTGSYSTFALPEKVNGPFVLEFDVTPVKSDESSTFRFGVGTDKKDNQKGPLLMVELANKKDGRLFYVKTVSKENALNLVGSSPSTGSAGSTVRFEDNSTYHVKLTYYASDSRVSIVVQEPGSSGILFSTSAPVSGKIVDLSHLLLTAVGDGTSGPQAEGYIDNIKLTRSESQPTTTPTQTITEVITTVPTLDTNEMVKAEEPAPVLTISSSRTPFPTPPTPAPTGTPKSGATPLVILPALAGGVLLALRRNS